MQKMQEFAAVNNRIQSTLVEAAKDIKTVNEEVERMKQGRANTEILKNMQSALDRVRQDLDTEAEHLSILSLADPTFESQAEIIIKEAKITVHRLQRQTQRVTAAINRLTRTASESVATPEAELPEKEKNIREIQKLLETVIKDEQKEAIEDAYKSDFVLLKYDDLVAFQKLVTKAAHPDVVDTKHQSLQTARELAEQLPDSEKARMIEKIDETEGTFNYVVDVRDAVNDLVTYLGQYKDLSIGAEPQRLEDESDDQFNKRVTAEKERRKKLLPETKQKILKEILPSLDKTGLVVDIVSLHPDFQNAFPWRVKPNLETLEGLDLELDSTTEWSDVEDERCAPVGLTETIQTMQQVKIDLETLKPSAATDVQRQIETILNEFKFSLSVLNSAKKGLEQATPAVFMPLYDRKRYTAVADNLKAYVEKLKHELGVAPAPETTETREQLNRLGEGIAVAATATMQKAESDRQLRTLGEQIAAAAAQAMSSPPPPPPPDLDFSNFLTAIRSAAEHERDEQLLRNWAEGLVGATQLANQTHETEVGVAKQIKEYFNINQADLESVEGWQYLTPGQQRLVLENFKQIMAGRIEDEAIVEQRKEQKRAGFLGRVWRGVFKGYYTAKERKSAADTFQTGGLAVHGEIFEQLIQNVRASGVAVEIADTGELELQYIAVPDSATPEQRRIMEKFNKAAAEFSRVPHSWTEQFASASDRSKYEQAKQIYQDAKEELSQLLARNLGDAKAAALQLLELDRKVIMNQFFQRHGDDLEEKLAQYGTKDIIKQAFNNIVVERGGYFAFGFVSRTLLAGIVGLAAAPLTAAVTGGFMGRRRAVEQLREERQLGKGSGQRGLAGRGSVGDTTPLAETKELVGTVGARDLISKIERLIEQISAEADESKKKPLRGRLDTRLNYTMQKLDRGEVGFGSGREHLAAQYDLLQVMAAGETAMTTGDKSVMKKLNERLESFISTRDERVTKHLNKQMLKGAFYGATFAAAGVAVRELWDMFSAGQHQVFSELETKEEIEKRFEEAVKNVPKPSEPTPEVTEVVKSPDVVNKLTPENLPAALTAKLGYDPMVGKGEGISTGPMVRDITAHPERLGAYKEIKGIEQILAKHTDSSPLTEAEIKRAAGLIYRHDFGSQDLRVDQAGKVAVVFDGNTGRYQIGTLDGSEVEKQLYTQDKIEGADNSRKAVPSEAEQAVSGRRQPILTQIEVKNSRGAPVKLDKGGVIYGTNKPFYLNTDDGSLGGQRAYFADGKFVGIYKGSEDGQPIFDYDLDKSASVYQDLAVTGPLAPEPAVAPTSSGSEAPAVLNKKTPFAGELKSGAKLMPDALQKLVLDTPKVVSGTPEVVASDGRVSAVSTRSEFGAAVPEGAATSFETVPEAQSEVGSETVANEIRKRYDDVYVEAAAKWVDALRTNKLNFDTIPLNANTNIGGGSADFVRRIDGLLAEFNINRPIDTANQSLMNLLNNPNTPPEQVLPALEADVINHLPADIRQEARILLADNDPNTLHVSTTSPAHAFKFVDNDGTAHFYYDEKYTFGSGNKGLIEVKDGIGGKFEITPPAVTIETRSSTTAPQGG